jgi:broad specificity phosphatase PhoE
MKEDYYELIFDSANRDARLSVKGIEEALKQRELIRALGITKVLVSPMRRAVETAILCATGLGLNLEICLIPLLREQITFKNTVCSTPDEIRTYITKL